MKTVFVGVPTLNRPHLVVDTIASLRRQSFTDFRVIVSDNLSHGDAADRVADHIAGLGDERFAFYRQAENGGEYGQGHFFFSASAGSEFFLILHDDDILEPDFLELAVCALRAQHSCALFVANPYAIDAFGRPSRAQTAAYLRQHGRERMAEGRFDILSAHLDCGFAPVSGTLFRRSALVQSGFAEADGRGSYPFECDLFLRLGDIGATGWFSRRQLLALRFHDNSMRTYLKLIDNDAVVHATLQLLARRRYSGPLEARRRVLVSRLHRAEAMIKLRRGEIEGCRISLRAALRENWRSAKAWAMAVAVWLWPGALQAILPRLPQVAEGPRYAATIDPSAARAASGMQR